MATTRFIDCIGASDEDAAHLRLLLRSAIIHLRDVWRWGPENKADLVVVDARSLIGDSALRRTQQRGVPCAQLIEADDPAPEGRFLRKPLRREELVALLNGIGESTVIMPLQLLTQGDDFFDLDLGEPVIDEAALPQLEFSLLRSESERAHDSFESLFHRDPLADKPQFLMPEKLDDEAGLEFVRDTTTRSESRADSAANPFARDTGHDGFIDPGFRHDLNQQVDDNETYPLAAYLEPGLLGGPAVIEWVGGAALVLDPKKRVFHSEGRLPALEVYFRKPVRYGDWKRLVNTELEEWRRKAPARPYQRLVWMARYLTSDGHLAAHLDPAGSYRLTRWLELAQDYPRAFRVGTNMVVAQRLGDIARVSEMSMTEVFNVVNAYEAIGYVEWTRRQRVQREGED